jgi:hypothetical protein
MNIMGYVTSKDLRETLNNLNNPDKLKGHLELLAKKNSTWFPPHTTSDDTMERMISESVEYALKESVNYNEDEEGAFSFFNDIVKKKMFSIYWKCKYMNEMNISEEYLDSIMDDLNINKDNLSNFHKELKKKITRQIRLNKLLNVPELLR